MPDLGPYWAGDTPEQNLTLDLVDELEAAQLEYLEDATVEGMLLGPAGTIVATLAAAPLVDEQVNLQWPALAEPLFNEPGKFTLLLTVRAEGITRLLDPAHIVVQSVNDPLNLVSVRLTWKGAPQDDARLFDLLTVAQNAVDAYGHSSKVGPESIAQAVIMQARNIWNGTAQNDDNSLGYGDYAAPVYPLDRQVKNLLRPRRAVPVVR